MPDRVGHDNGLSLRAPTRNPEQAYHWIPDQVRDDRSRVRDGSCRVGHDRYVRLFASRFMECALIQLGNQFDFNAGAQRNLRDAEGTASMRTGCAKDLAQQFAGTVGDQMLLGEIAG